MPALLEYPEDPKAVDDALRKEAKERGDLSEAAWEYYHGKHRKPLKVRTGQPDDNIILNLCRRVADQSVSLLVGHPPEFQIEEGTQTPEETRLDEVLEANHWDILLHDVATAGAVTGHVVLRLVQKPERIRIVRLPTASFAAFWKPDDMDAIVFYTVSWQNAENENVRQDIVREGNGWRVYEWALRRNVWTPVAEESWPYEWPPVLDWKNLPNPGEYYGESDIIHADMNDMVNFVASNTNRIIRHHAHPKTIGIGMQADQVQETTVDGFWSVPNAQAQIFNLEMQSDLRSSMDFMNLVRSAFFSVSRAVDLSVFGDQVGRVTNFGLRVLFQDALNKLETKRSLYGAGFEELCKRALDMAGMGYEHDIMLHWPEALPYNDAEVVQVLAQELELGLMSKETAAKERGRDWEAEQERMAIEQTAQEKIGRAHV